jgi:hypothetical protein
MVIKNVPKIATLYFELQMDAESSPQIEYGISKQMPLSMP